MLSIAFPVTMKPGQFDCALTYARVSSLQDNIARIKLRFAPFLAPYELQNMANMRTMEHREQWT